MSHKDLEALSKRWKPGQEWECKAPNGNWHTLPPTYQPGWFYDTSYRRIE